MPEIHHQNSNPYTSPKAALVDAEKKQTIGIMVWVGCFTGALLGKMTTLKFLGLPRSRTPFLIGFPLLVLAYLVATISKGGFKALPPRTFSTGLILAFFFVSLVFCGLNLFAIVK